MKLLPFKESNTASIGMELEYQIVNPRSFSLESKAKDLLRSIHERSYQEKIKPEVTQSMIEINSGVHSSVKDLLAEMEDIQQFLLEISGIVDICICGGGTHPFQKWSMQKIFPSPRYKKLSHLYQYLSKQATVFGMHIHVGCPSAEDALFLTHALARYVPHFVAMSASSPFYQGVDTGYYSSRTTQFSSYPLSGVIPYLQNWQEFSDYFYKLRDFNIVESMKDFYWDIRPKPEFGTVEIRVCDVPLTVRKAVLIVAYVQALSLYLLKEKPDKLCHDLYYFYFINRFQAARFGFEGELINPYTLVRSTVYDDILQTLKKIEHYANELNNMPYVSKLMDAVLNKRNDTVILRKLMKQYESLPKVVQEQCKMWQSDIIT